jgi:hypothetical protein
VECPAISDQRNAISENRRSCKHTTKEELLANGTRIVECVGLLQIGILNDNNVKGEQSASRLIDSTVGKITDVTHRGPRNTIGIRVNNDIRWAYYPVLGKLRCSSHLRVQQLRQGGFKRVIGIVRNIAWMSY